MKKIVLLAAIMLSGLLGTSCESDNSDLNGQEVYGTDDGFTPIKPPPPPPPGGGYTHP